MIDGAKCGGLTSDASDLLGGKIFQMLLMRHDAPDLRSPGSRFHDSRIWYPV